MEKKQVTLKNGEVVSYVEQGQGEKTIILIHGNFSSSLESENTTGSVSSCPSLLLEDSGETP